MSTSRHILITVQKYCPHLSKPKIRILKKTNHPLPARRFEKRKTTKQTLHAGPFPPPQTSVTRYVFPGVPARQQQQQQQQGILTATEREVVRKNGVLATAFREFASQPANTLDAHSLGALGARNLMGMGFVRARVRMFGRPVLSLGWTEKASNMCLVSVFCSPSLPDSHGGACIVISNYVMPFFFLCIGKGVGPVSCAGGHEENKKGSPFLRSTAAAVAAAVTAAFHCSLAFTCIP